MGEKSRTPWLDSLERAERIRDARERFKAEHPDEAEAIQRAREAEAEARFGPFEPPKPPPWQQAIVERVGRGHLLPPIMPPRRFARPPAWYVELLRALGSVVHR
ncbi:hypothetical protein IU438_28760 [Nocardia cyriacigeorgica]|uniref:hypothetical protein n=1 Tax=Nocardia cyriacigeorgica TaxID=135487 RepID=UPI0018933CE1|nr:hypothetical protein [Nocardia cyriacigeorgica]MBF6399764.1 hypothetical protein [Nocardia cyriacigeorgica]MBF6405407.1 hypothetical protein [Nocardia cyriacigeorgica]